MAQSVEVYRALKSYIAARVARLDRVAPRAVQGEGRAGL